MKWLCLLVILLSVPALSKSSTSLFKITNLGTSLMKSTYLIKSGNGKSLGSAFILGEPILEGKPFVRPLLVTANHVLKNIEGNTAQIYFHYEKDGEHISQDAFLTIRSKGKPLWTRHPHADVAVLPINIPKNIKLDIVSTRLLVTDQQLKKFDVRPGDQIYAIGFPFGVVSNMIGFPILRSGVISSYPIVPTAKNPSLLVDFKIFPGNSGGPVYFLDKNRVFADGSYNLQVISFILGLVSQEKFFAEQRTSLTESTVKKHPLGLGKIVPAPFIRETIQLFLENNKIEMAKLRAQVSNLKDNTTNN